MTVYQTPLCSMRMDSSYQPTYFVGGLEVTEEVYLKAKRNEERECRKLHKPQRRKRYKMPANYGDLHDFSRERDPETGRDGRYMPQLARFPGDPRAVVRHVNDTIEIAKRRGYGVERW